ncbi:cadherin-like beta sandwich domain-containing protein [Anaerocolumna sp. AGMB13025]|uniref:cadherin-like beta sandwich domain-containing protein n=1 Tax=Anaerocolumna sp. AGMB13025 TaxID=3039116 RepID=UPI00241F3C67|nr:cadherin-like beta sandwich domain-containing protein [Anaerocolumna sp. AGMB13025]WFR57580.1 cadherin-like beta sandwich domain-containing protein [Anaerocolumna sp. AGMB13025]
MGNVALNKIASSNMSVAPFTPDKAVSGISAAIDRWVGTVPGFVTLDLGYPYWINQWTIKHMGCIAGWETYIMKDYTLQGSDDGENWTEVSSISDNTLVTTEMNFSPCRYQYFRTYVSKGLAVNNSVASIVEFGLEEYDDSPYLSKLTLSAGTLTPAFYKQTFTYTATVPQDQLQINVTPTTSAANATIKVNGQTVANSHVSQNINLDNDTTIITIVVTINNTNIKETYTVTVIKNPSPYIDDIIIPLASMTTNFNSNITAYEAYVDADVTGVNVTAIARTPAAVVNVNGKLLLSGESSGDINLVTGSNLISVYVEYAIQPIIYEINVIRLE